MCARWLSLVETIIIIITTYEFHHREGSQLETGGRRKKMQNENELNAQAIFMLIFFSLNFIIKLKNRNNGT